MNDNIEELAKKIAEAVAKNSGVAPQLCYAPALFVLQDATFPVGDIPELLTAEQIEDCFPETGSGTCKFPCGKITVSSQFLHDFAANIQRRYVEQKLNLHTSDDRDDEREGIACFLEASGHHGLAAQIFAGMSRAVDNKRRNAAIDSGRQYAEQIAGYRYLRETTTAIRNPETGERIECGPEEFDAMVALAVAAHTLSKKKD